MREGSALVVMLAEGRVLWWSMEAPPVLLEEVEDRISVAQRGLWMLVGKLLMVGSPYPLPTSGVCK